MKSRNLVRASLAAALLFGAAAAVWALESGPQPGDKLTPFEPLHVNGESAGQEKCLV